MPLVMATLASQRLGFFLIGVSTFLLFCLWLMITFCHLSYEVPMRPKARGMAHTAARLVGWLEESDSAVTKIITYFRGYY